MKLVQRMLKRQRVTFGGVSDGDEIPAELQAADEAGEPYNVILLDIVMKRTNGVSVCQELRKKYGEDLKIIAMTANATTDDINIYKSTGFSACLPKPFDTETLKRCLLENSVT